MSEVRHRLRGSGRGAEYAYLRGGDLVVEWYDFGDDAPYESANLLILDGTGQRALAAAMGADAAPPGDLAAKVAAEFASWFELRAFLDAWGITARSETDFQP